MAATDYIWYHDYTTRSKQRRRIEVVCAHSSAITRTLEPAWGEDPALGSTFRKIPAKAISVPTASEPQARFEKWTVGMSDTPVYEVEVDYAYLYRDDDGAADADVQAFATALRSYNDTTAGTLTSGVDTMTFATQNCWTMLSDEGVAATAIADFTTRFQGVQRPLSEKEGTLVSGRSFRQKYTLFSVLRAAADAVPMSWVAQEIVRLYSAAAVEYGRLVDTVWIDAVEKYRWWLNGRTTSTAKMYTVVQLFEIIQAYLQVAYRAFTRDAGGEVKLSGFHADAATTAATPWDHWIFYTQDKTAGMQPGAVVARASRYFVGEILVDGTARGGLLIADGGDDTLADPDLSAWDFISQSVTAAVAKGRIEQTTRSRIDVRFMRPLETLASHTITITDCIRGVGDGGRTTPLEVPIVEGYGTVANITGELRQTRGDDRPTFVEKIDGSLADDGGNIPLVFDTNPTVGEEEDWWYSDTAGNYYLGSSSRFNSALWKLYYIEDSFGDGASYPTRCSHHCGFDDGITTHSPAAPYTSLPVGGYDQYDEDNRTAWRDDVRIQLSTAQRHAYTVPALAARIAAMIFGTYKQTKYTLTLPTSAIGINDIGERFDLSPVDGSGNYTAQALAGTTDVDLSDLPGRCYALSITVDDDIDHAEVELLGLDF